MAKKQKGISYSVIGIIFAICSLLAFPIIFSPIAVVFGYLALKNNDEKGWIAIVLGIVLGLLSWILGMYFLSM